MIPPRGKFGSPHVSLVQFLFLDGHITAIDSNLGPARLLALCTIAGRETVDSIP